MNQEHLSGPLFRTDLDWFVLAVVFLLALPVIVVLVRFVWPRIRCRTNTQPVSRPDRTIRLMPSRTTMFAMLRESVWLLVPYVVALSFVIMSDPSLFASKFGRSANHDRFPSPTRSVSEGKVENAPTEQPRRVSAPVVTSPSLALRVGGDTSPTQQGGGGTDSSARAALLRPAWVDQPRVFDGDCTRIVLTSQQYATKEEAEAELRVAAVALVEQDLQRIQTGSFGPKTWQPRVEDVIAHAVQQRYDEIADRDFGKFTHPMIRVSWQVELSPRVRTEFAPAWRRELISFRIKLVAAVAIDFTALACLSLMYFRISARLRSQSHKASHAAD